MQTTVKRVIIKLSGEALSSNDASIDSHAITQILIDIAEVLKLGVEVAIVIGGGNILRGGRSCFGKKIERATSDHMGMLATMINALALQDILNHSGIEAVALSSYGIDGVISTASITKATSLLTKKKVVIFAGGTGNPFVTTDSAASLRACEIKADALLKATGVDGIYDKDPNQFNDAKRFDRLQFNEVLQQQLAVMDLTAFIQCRDFNIPICVFNMHNKQALVRVVTGQKEGTWVKG